MNIIEAQACGCAVVAPRVGGIPEIIEHKKTGYLYDRTKGISAIEEAIDWLYADGNYDRVTHAALQSAKERFCSKRMCDQYYEVYLEAMRSHQGQEQMGVVGRHALLVALITKRKLKGFKRRLPVWMQMRIRSALGRTSS